MEQQNGQATLFAKLARVMGRLERIPKTGKNAHFGYMFATDADVSDAVRKELADEGIAFFASMVYVQQEGKKTRAEFDFTFACGETGATMTCHWVGESDDAQDKGISKAATSALKYFLLKTFIFSTGDKEDDPDSQPPVEAKAKKADAQPKRIIGRDEPTPGPAQHQRGTSDELPAESMRGEMPPAAIDDDRLFNGLTLAEMIDYTIEHSADIEAGDKFHGGGRLYKSVSGKDGKPVWTPAFFKELDLSVGEAKNLVDAYIANKQQQPALMADKPADKVAGGPCKGCGDITTRKDLVGNWECEDCAAIAADEAFEALKPTG